MEVYICTNCGNYIKIEVDKKPSKKCPKCSGDYKSRTEILRYEECAERVLVG